MDSSAFSIASIAASISPPMSTRRGLPVVGSAISRSRARALALRFDQRAISGTQKTRAARVFLGVLRVGEFLLLELRALKLESVGDVFQENQAEGDMLIFRRLEIAAQLVGGLEQFRLEIQVAAAVPRARHGLSSDSCAR